MARRRGSVVLMVLLPVLAGVAACAGVGSGADDAGAAGAQSDASWSGTPGGALSTMGFGSEDDVGQARIAAFAAAAPDVQVRINKGDFDAQQFLTALASGNPPDRST